MTDSIQTNETEVLRWFTGKGLENARWALVRIKESLEQGSWVKGARSVKAALGKVNAAAKQLAPNSYNVPAAVSAVYYASVFGSYPNLLKISPEVAAEQLSGDALEFFNAFRKVAEVVDLLDAMRPKPVFTNLGVSPTITSNLKDMGLDARPETIRMCPIEWRQVEYVGLDGKKQYYWEGLLKWPAGTVHGSSRFSRTDRNRQCQACGHAIKNPFNWLPLLIDNKDGVPHSLWVGRDCAKNLFGIDMQGDLQLSREE